MRKTDIEDRIRSAVLALMRVKAIDRIRVAEVTALLGVSRSTFYRYFDSVYDVVQELEDEYFDDLKDALASFEDYPFSDAYFSKPYPGIIAIAKVADAHSETLDVLFGRYGEPLFLHKCRSAIEGTLFRKAVREGYVSSSEEAVDMCGAFLVAGQIELVRKWLEQGKRVDVREFALLSYRLAFGPYRFERS